MKLSDVVGHAGLELYPQIALVLFLLAFVIVVVRLVLPSQQALYERAGRMALDDGDTAPPAHAPSQAANPDEDRLLEHDYDGIREYDNPMPRWWVYLFWGTIAFSVLYAMNVVDGVGSGPGRIARYEAELAAQRAKEPPRDAAAAPSEDSLRALVGRAEVVASGRAAYATNCAACHGALGGGAIGPNLTDDHWLHGGTLPEIHRTVSKGVLDKGMPPWEKILKPDQVTAVVAYIATLHGTNPPGAKAPQGEPVKSRSD
jgi:cytochrome c oxidase cbb3-type subunit 3